MQDLNFEAFLARNEEQDLYVMIEENKLELPAWV
jgi:hypothetical protein